MLFAYFNKHVPVEIMPTRLRYVRVCGCFTQDSKVINIYIFWAVKSLEGFMLCKLRLLSWLMFWGLCKGPFTRDDVEFSVNYWYTGFRLHFLLSVLWLVHLTYSLIRRPESWLNLIFNRTRERNIIKWPVMIYQTINVNFSNVILWPTLTTVTVTTLIP